MKNNFVTQILSRGLLNISDDCSRFLFGSECILCKSLSHITLHDCGLDQNDNLLTVRTCKSKYLQGNRLVLKTDSDIASFIDETLLGPNIGEECACVIVVKKDMSIIFGYIWYEEFEIVYDAQVTDWMGISELVDVLDSNGYVLVIWNEDNKYRIVEE